MCTDWTARVWAHSPQIGTAKLLLLAIAQVAEGDGSTVALNMSALAHLVGTKERNIQTLLKKLEGAGELRREFGVGPHGRTRYTLLHPSIDEHGVGKHMHLDAPVHLAAQGVNPTAPPPHPGAPQTGALEDTSLRKERVIDGGERSAPAMPIADNEETPSGEPPLPAAPFVLWQTARSALQPLDEAHLCALVAELDGPTEGFGAYWLGRAILAASMTDEGFATNPRALNLVRAILRRWRREGSYGSDTAAYLTRQEHTHAAQPPSRPAPKGSYTDRRPARPAVPAGHAPVRPTRATACTIIGRDADGER